ncbi:MAG: glycosyltransferase [Pseudomonadota bacterium]
MDAQKPTSPSGPDAALDDGARRAQGAPRVSIVVPVFNSDRYLRECVESLFAQTVDDFEIIIVDDGSTDGTPALLATLAGEAEARGVPFKVLSQVNAGPSPARNAGIKAARADFILFVDSDDRCDPEVAETLLSRMHAPGASRPDVVFPLVRYIDADGVRHGAIGRPHGGFSLEEIIVSNPIHTMTGVLARRQALLDLGGFDESFRSCGDFELWLRVARGGGDRIDCVWEPLVDHRRHGAQTTSVLDRMQENWRRAVDKARSAHPERVARVEALALARVKLYWSSLAQEVGAFGDARAQFISAWRLKPLRLMRERQFWKRAFATAGLYLPSGPRRFLERMYDRTIRVLD